MAKITVDPELKGQELYKFLKDNKKQLIAQKKEFPKKCDSVTYMPSYFTREEAEDGTHTIKAITAEEIPADANALLATVVANTSMWCDSAMDVLLKDSAKKSIKERKGMIPHIHDHIYEVTAEVGDVQRIFYQDIALRQLGLKQDGDAQALIFETMILRSLNEQIFEKYRTKRIKQHSIGLQYIDLWLAINEPEDDYYEDEYKIWKKYIDQVINKEVPEAKGYFWVVPEYRLLENSCVLLGANILTPTLSTSAKGEPTTEDEPDESTHKQPENVDEPKPFDLITAIKQTKFI